MSKNTERNILLIAAVVIILLAFCCLMAVAVFGFFVPFVGVAAPTP